MIVISLGGSLISKEKIDMGYIKEIVEILREAACNFKLAVVVGGGRTAREYINAAKGFTDSYYMLDRIGIEATRLNALLLISALEDIAYPEVPRSVDEAVEYIRNSRIVVMGGTEPGHTTDAVAALLAERLRAQRLIIATNVDGVYDKDPRKYKDARKLKKLTFRELLDIVMSVPPEPGVNTVIDHLAALIINRSKIRTIVINGLNPKELKNAIYGLEVEGSVIE
ncbi:MAG: UMP kinase [Thermoplasmata archaeon]|nr:MAG: UMP kinase [Thermoplasmata archaeon]